MFYVYIHYKASNGLPFYVGKGTKNRAWVTSGRNSRWKRTYDKHGRIVEIVLQTENESTAFDYEMKVIQELFKEGYDLCNLTVGGEGTTGHKCSPEMVERIRQAHLGKPKTKESITKRWETLRSKGWKPNAQHMEALRSSLIGRKHSEETKLKRAQSVRAAGAAKSPFILLVNWEDSTYFIGTRREAEETLNIKRTALKNAVDGWSNSTSRMFPVDLITLLLLSNISGEFYDCFN